MAGAGGVSAVEAFDRDIGVNKIRLLRCVPKQALYRGGAPGGGPAAAPAARGGQAHREASRGRAAHQNVRALPRHRCMQHCAVGLHAGLWARSELFAPTTHSCWRGVRQVQVALQREEPPSLVWHSGNVPLRQLIGRWQHDLTRGAAVTATCGASGPPCTRKAVWYMGRFPSAGQDGAAAARADHPAHGRGGATLQREAGARGRGVPQARARGRAGRARPQPGGRDGHPAGAGERARVPVRCCFTPPLS